MVSRPRSPTQTLVADETVHEERGDSVERAATTAASLDTEQASGNINRTQSTTIPNEPFPQEISSGGSPRHQETKLGDMPAQTRFEWLSKQPHDSPLPRVNTLGSDEGGLKLQELMVKTLEKTVKSSQARRRARMVVSDDEEDLEDPSKQERKIAKIDEDPDISLFITAEEVYTAEPDVSTAELVSTAGASTKTKLQQEQERLGYEAALRLQEQLDEEERQRIASVHEAASFFNIEEWEDIQARIEADEELAQRLQAKEREKYSEAKKARLLVELINKRKRHFAQQRAEERRNKPLT
ncbi:hypothetical protein Tco_0205411 [Tanacetum coccineum]